MKCSRLMILSVCLPVYVCISVVSGMSRHSAIKFMNNGYSDILIAIHPEVKEDAVLINSIKEMMDGASDYLYTATEGRAYFSNVTILIPNTWTNTLSWPPAKSENYNNADVVIENSVPQRKKRSLESNLKPSSGSYTQMFGGCGMPGIRIHLFTDIFDSNGRETYGPSSRVFVHEWAHFRWGVFDEFPQEGEEQFYFSPSTMQLEAVRCNLHIAGELIRLNNGSDVPCDLRNRSLENCIFKTSPHLQLNENITASIMDKIMIPSITHFCNDDHSDIGRVHNNESPSRQNRLCSGKSTWTVISESEDFNNGKNSPRNVQDRSPSFKLVKATSAKRLILAIDTSRSMNLHDNLMKTRQVVSTFVEDVLVDGTELGIISFSDSADMIVPMTKITDDASRQNVATKLPSKCEGATDIGSALLKSLEVLERQSTQPSDTFIVVITDGSDTTGSNMNNVVETVIEAGAVVSIIALSNGDNRGLEQLAILTGGRYYFSSFSTISALEALLDICTLLDVEQSHSPVLIISQREFLEKSESLKGSFLLDSSLGYNTRISITYTTDKPPDGIIVSPSGRRYCSIYPEYYNDPVLRRVKFTIPALAEVGLWSYQVTNTDNSSDDVFFVVTSSSRYKDIPPLKFSGSIMVDNSTWPLLSFIVAEVIQGNQPLRNLKVKALVNRPMADPIEIELFDNGIGADIVKNDGIYSRYFTSFTISGRYSAVVEMSDQRGDMIMTGSLDGHYQVAKAYAGSVHIEHVKLPSLDTSSILVDDFPPMRITDLRVLQTSQAEGMIVLAWTAPGDDADHDRASYYNILMSHTADTLIDAMDLPIIDSKLVIQGKLDSPQPFGMREKIVLKMETYKNKNESFVFAVFAVDDSGNKGRTSNLVTVGFGYAPDVVTQEYLNDLMSDRHPDTKVAPADQKVAIASVVGLAAGLLVVTIIGTFIVHYAALRRAKQKEREFSEAKNVNTVTVGSGV
ncbi:calcium-activated chloride channel regulator 2 [Biomphalaria glabrata]|uniref:Calcium-activated chloride channel regulator 1-like isoform X2 n=1 Tax=Biomphalaria glabrata TaxID=6526 RepID=A0A9W2ZNF8_BIOGL|nr:calcium-activated chloride channel regulator 1-like isoform X2 [Biomphalaria glabrata]KAI8765438.1 calcium-activated chloride channel regulator 2-like [Biomphalaria glabrata]